MPHSISSLYPAFLTHLRKTRLLPSGSRILLALSGGLDSTVLCHLLAELCERMAWTVVVGHVNYKQRGADSDRDEAFVHALAERLGLRAISDSGFHYSKTDSGNFQDIAREYRYRLFARWLAEEQLQLLCTAHHRDDQIETVLFRLLRGAGVHGLSGMRQVQHLRIDDKDISIVRPLLPFSRTQVLDYAREREIAFCEDASNALPLYTRNRIRHELIPLLADLAPQFSQRLEGLRHFFAQVDDFFSEKMEPLIQMASPLEQSVQLPPLKRLVFSLPRAQFLTLPLFFRSEALYRLFQHYLPHAFVARETIDKLGDLIVKNRSLVHYELASGFHFEKDAEHVRVYCAAGEQ